MDSILSAGIAGVQAGQSSALSAAQKITSAVGSGQPKAGSVNEINAANSNSLDNITEGVVELVASEQQVQASASVIETADEVLGTLIDTKA